MARVVIPAVALTPDGAANPTEANGDTTNGHFVTNTGKTNVTVRNADAGGAHSVTFLTPITVGGKAVADQVVSIPASSTREFGNFAVSLYGSTLQVDVDSTQLKLAARQP